MTYKLILNKLLPFLKPHLKYIAGVFIALLFTSGSVLGIGKGIEYLIDQGFSKRDIHLFDEALLVLLCFAAALAIATFFRSYFINLTCERVAADIRIAIFSRLIRLPLFFFEQHKISDIITRLTNDITLINTLITGLLSTLIRNMILFLGSILLMVTTSTKLTLFVFMLIPFIVVPIILYSKKLRNLTQIYLAETSNIAVDIQESFNGISLIKTFAVEDNRIRHFTAVNEHTYHTAKTRITARSKFFAMVIALIFSAVSIVLWTGGKNVLNGTINPGELSSFLFYAILVASSAGAIVELLSEFSKAKEALTRVFTLFNYETEYDGDEILPLNNLNIKFNNITFAYPSNPSKNVLEGFNLEIKPGQKIAFVGHSGSGKTTLFSLLLRLYDINKGSIWIGDEDINSIKLNMLRPLFAVVPQETIIFSATILENIAFANPNANLEQIIEATKAAEIYDFIISLPAGFDTFVGERGMRLSGGQKQRIALSRAFLRQAPILLLDEATSSLDVQNETEIQKAIEKLMHGKTIIVISHRLSTIIKADLIVVVDKGKLIRAGKHQELLESCDIYKNLYNLTFEK